MELVASGIDLLASPHGIVVDSPTKKSRRASRSRPPAESIDRAIHSTEFEAFTDEVRRELDPRGPLERLIVDHVVRNAWQLKTKLEQLADQVAVGRKNSMPTSFLNESSLSLKQSLESLASLQNCRSRAEVSRPTSEVEIEPNEWPIVPSERPLEGHFGSDGEVMIEESSSWRDRLVFDFEVSDRSPVVKGTWVTVSHVVSLIVDGWSWADVLRSHPELSENDIRTCIAYAMDEENTEG